MTEINPKIEKVSQKNGEYKGRILVVDDEEDILDTFSIVLEDEGYYVETSSDPVEALKLLREKDFDLVLSDMRMPKMTGEEFLEELRKFNSFTSFIIMTAYGTIDNAVSCMKKGAFHYLSKPLDFNDPSLWNLIEKAIKQSKILQENAKLKEEIKRLKTDTGFIITKNPDMINLLNFAKRIASLDLTVLITGESGVGKELFARAIHLFSNRRDKPFIPINCANISPDIMEAEFFGYRKGSFTGASENRKGIFEMANGGTVFLDEIGEVPLDIQSKFLRFLQEKEIRKVGEDKTIKVDVRIIAATNKDLKQLVKEGKFREDLYYRIEGIKIHIPPLRERKEDIPLLAKHFIQKFNEKYSASVKGITPEAVEVLLNYHWEGNVRQLENVIYKACIYAGDGFIDIKHLDKEILEENIKKDFIFDYNKAKEHHLQKFMKSYLNTLLSLTDGNVSKAAKLANIERQSLQKLLKRYGVNPEEYRKKEK